MFSLTEKLFESFEPEGQLPEEYTDKFKSFYNIVKQKDNGEKTLPDLAKEVGGEFIDDGIEFGAMKDVDKKVFFYADKDYVYLLEKYREEDGMKDAYYAGEFSEVYKYPFNHGEVSEAINVCTECLTETSVKDTKCPTCESSFLRQKVDKDFDKMLNDSLDSKMEEVQTDVLADEPKAEMDKEDKEARRQNELDVQIESYRKTLEESEDDLKVKAKGLDRAEADKIAQAIQGKVVSDKDEANKFMVILEDIKESATDEIGPIPRMEPTDSDRTFKFRQEQKRADKAANNGVDFKAVLSTSMADANNPNSGSLAESETDISQIKNYVKELLEEQSVAISDFASFEEFFDFLDAVEFYEQLDQEDDMVNYADDLEVIFNELKNEKPELEVEQTESPDVPLMEKKDYSKKKRDETANDVVYFRNKDPYAETKRIYIEDDNEKKLRIGDKFVVNAFFGHKDFYEAGKIVEGKTYKVLSFDPDYSSITVLDIESNDEIETTDFVDNVESFEVK